jgi:hypothetical protein
MMDYTIETRMMALGLPILPPRRPEQRGRRRALSMLKRIEIAIAWGEYMNAHARIEAPRERGQVKALQRKLGAARANGDAQFLLNRMSAKLDGLGRVSREIVLPPRIALPEADRAIAKRFGVSERMVRKIRSDERMDPFMPHPIWKVPDWLRRGAELHAARAVARRLMTLERYAKNEPVALVGSGLVVGQDPAAEVVHKTALWAFGLMQRLEARMPAEYRSRPAWLGFQRQWARVEMPLAGLDRHSDGRRIAPKIQDQEAEKCSQELWADRTR